MRYQIYVFSLFLALLASSASAQSASNAEQLFDRGMNALKGTGASHNTIDGVELIRRSAELGYVPAEVVTGYFYDTGTNTTAQPGEAMRWYAKAADQDDRLADWLLGRLYYSGSGAPRDIDRAASYLKKAAERGDPFAQYLLGMIDAERHNYSNAVTWFRKAAEQGLPQAQLQLGGLLRQGLGTNSDKFEAYVWLLISFDAGITTGSTDLASLEAELGTTRLEQAKTKARDLERTVTRSVVAHGCTGWDGEFNVLPTPPPPDVQRFCR